MTVSHIDPILHSPAVQALGQFILARPQAWENGVPEFEQFEQELHARIMAVECECLGAELKLYDVAAREVVVGGMLYHEVMTSPETYLTVAGPVKVDRHLYRPAGLSSKKPLSAGIACGDHCRRFHPAGCAPGGVRHGTSAAR